MKRNCLQAAAQVIIYLIYLTNVTPQVYGYVTRAGAEAANVFAWIFIKADY